MARNSGGTYSLPSGNPVVTVTAISSTVHNNTMNDIKTELTDSLSRSNKGAMLAQLQLFSGTAGVPGLGWAADTDTGFYYIAPGNIGFSVGGVQVLDFTDDGLAIMGASPLLWMVETDAAVDEKRWLFSSVAGDFYLSAYNDAIDALSNPLIITRTGTVINSITFAGTQINLNCTAAAVNGALAVSTTLTVNSIAITPSKGSFTIELATEAAGGSVIASGTAYWEKHGNICTVMLPYLAGVTTDIVPWIRGMPAAIIPSLTGSYVQTHVCKGMVNGAPGLVTIGVSETTYWEISGASATFNSSSNEKGVGESGNYGPTITYLLGN